MSQVENMLTVRDLETFSSMSVIYFDLEILSVGTLNDIHVVNNPNFCRSEWNFVSQNPWTNTFQKHCAYATFQDMWLDSWF